MHDRRNIIPESHPQTFSWIFESRVSPFKSWLRQHSGAFWSSGKAGSGKSTLMKYIIRSTVTAAILRQWAEGRKLFTASFYFWITGSRMQKNQEGLLQSILVARWERHHHFHHDPDPLTLSELYDALDAIIYEKPKACFCFFVDGLDEFVGDSGQQGEFAERIHRLATSTSVKLCVASRPWLAFDNVFGKDEQRMLVLENLTRDDMDAYVRNSLSYSEETLAQSGLVRGIRDKARGMFLWVTLVVKSLLSGLTQHDDLEGLRRRLHALPSDLREFFGRMLNSIDDGYKLYTSRILFLALHARPLPLMTFWWVQVETTKPDYAICTAIKEIKPTPQSTKTAKVYLDNWSKDLLAVYDVTRNSASSGDMRDFRIDFLHRTVGDFLQEPEVHEQLRKQSGPGFDPEQSICRLMLAEAKTLPLPEDPIACCESLQAIACRIMYHAKQPEIQHCHSLATILWDLDKTITARLETVRGPSSLHWTASIRDSHVIKAASHRKVALDRTSNFLAYAVANDLLEFVREILLKSPLSLQKPGRPLLDFAIYPTFPEHDLTDDSRDSAYLESMIRLLLDFGSVPDQHTKVIGSVTVWQLFLLDSHDRPPQQTRPGAWDVARLMLEHNANRQAEVPVDKTFSTISNHVVSSNVSFGQDLTSMMDTIRFASVKDCLSQVEQSHVVSDFMRRLPTHDAGVWASWKPWFL